MSEIAADSKLLPTQSKKVLKYGLQALLLLPLFAAFLIYRLWFSQPTVTAPATATVTEAVTTTITQEQLEERFGVRIALIGVTAGGGIVDFRYRILDKEKAAFFVGDTDNPPVLIAEDSGTTLVSPNHTMKHNSDLEEGITYFRFYPNSNNAVHPGTPVSVVVGAIRVEPIIAQ